MITLQEYTFAQLYAESIKISDVQVAFNVGEIYADSWVKFIKLFDLRKFEFSNNGIVYKLSMILQDSSTVTIEKYTDYLKSCKTITMTFNNQLFEVKYKNLEDFNAALNELRKYYEQNHNTIQRFESK